MTTPDAHEMSPHDRRKFPRYYVFSRLMLAIEDETIRESIGIGERPIWSRWRAGEKPSGLSECSDW
jgi:hypothetical protein